MDYLLEPPDPIECPRCSEFLVEERCPDADCGFVIPIDEGPDPDLAYDRQVERDWDYILEDSRS